jgi:hypothetical protein
MLLERWTVSDSYIVWRCTLLKALLSRVIYTAGTDSMVRIHSVSDLETGEPEFLDDHPEAVTCCVSSVSGGAKMSKNSPDHFC